MVSKLAVKQVDLMLYLRQIHEREREGERGNNLSLNMQKDQV